MASSEEVVWPGPSQVLGIQIEHHWGTPREPNGNPLRTLREHVRNKGKMKKILPPPKIKRKKIKAPWSACFSLPIGCMYFWFAKLSVTIFGLG